MLSAYQVGVLCYFVGILSKVIIMKTCAICPLACQGIGSKCVFLIIQLYFWPLPRYTPITAYQAVTMLCQWWTASYRVQTVLSHPGDENINH